MNKLDRKRVRLTGVRAGLEIVRDERGVPHILGSEMSDLAFGLGIAQARDRLLQMTLMKYISSGRAAEKLENSAGMIAVDRFVGRMGFVRSSLKDLSDYEWEDTVHDWINSYLQGINFYIKEGTRPLGMRIAGISAEPFHIADILNLMKLISYIGIAETQEKLERFILESFVEKRDLERLKRFFYPALEDADPEMVEGLKLGRDSDRERREIILRTIPPLSASNNWAVAPERTVSGKPVFAGDPHMDTGTMPGIWHEAVLESPGFTLMGAGIPGLGGLQVARNDRLAWSPTYASLDSVDLFIEEVKGENYLSPEGWKPLEAEDIQIQKRGSSSAETFKVCRTQHGPLDIIPAEDGRYVCVSHAYLMTSGVNAIANMVKINDCRSVEEAMKLARCGQGPSFAWAFADSDGNIGLQVAGSMPLRKPGRIGLAPCAGWKHEHQWDGLLSPDDLPSEYNPEKGWVGSCNNDLNRPDAPRVINIAMSPDRIKRIGEVIESRSDWTAEGMTHLQTDRYSHRAERFINRFHSILSQSEAGKKLIEWDFVCSDDSVEATLFELLYRHIEKQVLSDLFGDDAANYMLRKTGVSVFLAGHIEKEFIRYEDVDDLFKSFLSSLEEPESRPEPWGSVNNFTMKNMLLGNRFPRLSRMLGLNVEEIPVPGARDVVSQGLLFAEGCPYANFAPSYRFVTDMSEVSALTVRPSGISERRFSGFYTTDLQDWLAGKYKKLESDCP